MKITKRQLRRIIKEEKQKVIKEYGYGVQEVMNPTVAFAQAWASLGGSVQEQMVSLIHAHVEGRTTDAAGEINPNAFDLAKERLMPPLRSMDGDDAYDLMDMFESVAELYKEYGV